MKNETKKTVLIVGASSGIGEALVRSFGKRGYTLGMMARRVAVLQQLAKHFPTPCFVKFADVTDFYHAIAAFNDLIQEMGEVDIIILNSGVGFSNPDLEWDLEKKTIDVNVSGFTALADSAMQYFIKQGKGHLVGISSISALRGNDYAPAYNASKAFVSSYLQALQKKVVKEHLNICVTDIQPGFVDTPLIQGKTFWMASAEQAAEQIYHAINKRRKHAYVTKRWRFIAWLLKYTPDFIYNKWF